jgi:hypothetical protein
VIRALEFTCRRGSCVPGTERLKTSLTGSSG